MINKILSIAVIAIIFFLVIGRPLYTVDETEQVIITQFGRPIGSFQAIQHICANMLLQLESAKSVAYSAVRTDLSDGLEMEMSSLIAKSYCSEVFNKLAGDNIQVHGGIGFTWEHPAHLYFKKAKSDSLLLGTPKLARDRIAELLSL